jgi:hypothetical protein
MATVPGTNHPCEVLQLPDKIAAVYFLVKQGRVMYVGQTRNLYARTWQHELYKDFDEVLFIRCAPEELAVVERYWIDYFDPPWKSFTITRPKKTNVRLPPDYIS